jgi:hypothetical protein
LINGGGHQLIRRNPFAVSQSIIGFLGHLPGARSLIRRPSRNRLVRIEDHAMSTPASAGPQENHDPTLNSAHVVLGRVADARHAIDRPTRGQCRRARRQCRWVG